LTPDGMARAAAAAVVGARPHTHNAFKIELARRAVVRALQVAGKSAGEGKGGTA